MSLRTSGTLLAAGLTVGAVSGGWAAGPSGEVAARSDSATPPPAFIYNPPLAHTGGFGEPTCHVCHNEFELGFPGGSLELSGLPGAWEPGRSYSVVVTLQSDGMEVAGFQLAARFSDGRPAGTLAALDARAVVTDSTGIPYARQAQGGAIPESSRLARWRLEWTAPGQGGAVHFHAVANSGNGDTSPFGDLIYAVERVVARGPARSGEDAP